MSTDLNVLPEGWTVAQATEYGNIMGITGDFLTAEQIAEIDKAFGALTPEKRKRAVEITGAWLKTHHGFGLPSLNGIISVVEHEFKPPEEVTGSIICCSQKPYSEDE